MIGGMTAYEILLYFLIYSFLGWVVEVAFHAVTLGKVVNRGFLNGPWCPVYGSGVIVVFWSVHAMQSHYGRPSAFWVFVFGVVLATAVELFAGWALDVLFHARWWDYSNRPFNFHGYICLEFSILWGLGIVFIVRITHVFIRHTSALLLPPRYGWIVLAVVYAGFFTDLVITVAEMRGLNKKLSQIDKIKSDMRAVSDALSETVGTSTIETAQRIGNARVQTALAKAELMDFMDETREHLRAEQAESVEEFRQRSEQMQKQLQKRLEEVADSITRHRHFGTGHLLRAFPDMKHHSYPELIEALQERMKKK